MQKQNDFATGLCCEQPSRTLPFGMEAGNLGLSWKRSFKHLYFSSTEIGMTSCWSDTLQSLPQVHFMGKVENALGLSQLQRTVLMRFCKSFSHVVNQHVAVVALPFMFVQTSAPLRHQERL